MNVCKQYKWKVKWIKKNYIKDRMCYYFDDIINGTKNNFSNILLNKKLYENN